ncbi:MAG: CoA transferase [Pseudomonadales bacterium]|nr:CoA transferase [Pseudomonadales bacterium]MCP5171126.1 CoA transferase [Pseudomonadales bacterium]MCP5301637.1 CoA transferase [Pseudomonadales bacterium]
MGPLKGLKVVEMAGIGPAPFCAMLLADMGAEVVRIDRLVASDIGIPVPPKYDLLNRNKRSLAIDIKSVEGRETVLDLISKADVLIEGFRPGVMERLGLGPDECLKRNASLVYGRMTGWGQDGPLSQVAGHDINYIAITGALNAIGRQGQPPTVPLNLVGDFGGGSLYLAMGILAAIYEVKNSGSGQVVDAAISDGTANLMSLVYSYYQTGFWSLDRGENVVDSGSPFYDVYETSDGRYVSVGAVEKKFYADLLDRLGLDQNELPRQNDKAGWPALRDRFGSVFLSKTQAEWCEIFDGSDACFAPVLDINEAVHHPHNQYRKTHVDIDGVINPAPAPRFSHTPSEITKTPSAIGEDSSEVLAAWGYSETAIDDLKAKGVINTQ